jgi:ribonuclease HII
MNQSQKIQPLLFRQYSVVCGVDEAGRGPLAGPVVAAAVILPEGFPIGILKDSKQMSPRQRTEAAKSIRSCSLDCGIGWCWPEEIDKLNIHRATLLAMKRALSLLTLLPEVVFIDGRFAPQVNLRCVTVIQGDKKVPQIQAASILAKTTRDLWMERYARIETSFGFERNKGYPTREHRMALVREKPSAIHRRSFNLEYRLKE